MLHPLSSLVPHFMYAGQRLGWMSRHTPSFFPDTPCLHSPLKKAAQFTPLVPGTWLLLVSGCSACVVAATSSTISSTVPVSSAPCWSGSGGAVGPAAGLGAGAAGAHLLLALGLTDPFGPPTAVITVNLEAQCWHSHSTLPGISGIFPTCRFSRQGS